jgi:hypothetical protein
VGDGSEDDRTIALLDIDESTQTHLRVPVAQETSRILQYSTDPTEPSKLFDFTRRGIRFSLPDNKHFSHSLYHKTSSFDQSVRQNGRGISSELPLIE